MFNIEVLLMLQIMFLLLYYHLKSLMHHIRHMQHIRISTFMVTDSKAHKAFC